MRKSLSILFCLLAFSSCIKDDINSCAGLMHFHFSFMYGGTNRFFDMEKADLTAHFYKVGSSTRYRELNIDRDEIGPQNPLTLEKNLSDVDSLEFISWSQDEQIEYVNTPATPLGEGFVHLKEITAGSGICRPVDDLFYGRVKFDAKDRYQRNDIIVPYVRAVCRVRITMIPQTVNLTRAGDVVVPRPEDYVFHLMGTRNRIDDNNITGGEKIILQPDCYYDETTGNVVTNWFGAFGSEDKEYLKVQVYIREKPVAQFDCAPIEIGSVPGDYVDLVIDGHYLRPVMEVNVNGWKIANLTSNM